MFEPRSQPHVDGKGVEHMYTIAMEEIASLNPTTARGSCLIMIFTLDDVIGIHAFALLVANKRVTNSIPLGSPVPYRLSL
jgi:hypothetical protein